MGHRALVPPCRMQTIPLRRARHGHRLDTRAVPVNLQSRQARAQMRLDPQPGEVIDRCAPLTFRWNPRPYPAYAGDTIISALAAAGERVFSRSFKYHRPRGLLTASYLDPGCTVQVGDEPNVRGAHRQAEPGMDVRSQ